MSARVPRQRRNTWSTSSRPTSINPLLSCREGFRDGLATEPATPTSDRLSTGTPLRLRRVPVFACGCRGGEKGGRPVPAAETAFRRGTPRLLSSLPRRYRHHDQLGRVVIEWCKRPTEGAFGLQLAFRGLADRCGACRLLLRPRS